MPRCPQCGDEIEHFDYVEPTVECGTAYWNGDSLEHEDNETETNGETTYHCPHCSTPFGRREAEDILGGDEATLARENRENRRRHISRYATTTPKENLTCLIDKTFDLAKEIKGEDDAEFIQTLQDNDLWFCHSCGKVEKKANLAKLDNPISQDEMICQECIDRQK